MTGQGECVTHLNKKPGSVARSFILLVCVIGIFSKQIFFGIAGILSYSYAGVGDSQVYVVYIFLTSLCMIFTLLVSYLRAPGLSVAETSFYCFFVFLFCNHLGWAIIDNRETHLLPENLVIFLSIGSMGFAAARVIHAYDQWLEIIRITELIVVFLSIGLILEIVIPFFGNIRVRGLGGATYQDAAYYGAMCYGMLGLINFRLPLEFRYRIFRNNFIRVIEIMLMLVLVITVIITGGRGGFVLLTVYTLLLAFWFSARGSAQKFSFTRMHFSLFAMGLMIAAISAIIQRNAFLTAGVQRATAFLKAPSEGFIDIIGGSSGRGQIYSTAFNAIEESPFLGYGAFGNWQKTLQPHNLALDILLQFGVFLGGLMIVTVLFYVIRKYRGRANRHTEQVWVLTLSLYPLTQLMFSSGYLRSSVFWFCVSAFFLMQPRRLSNKESAPARQ